MAKKARKPASGDVATNRRARHKFELLDRIECGIELVGSEVKSLREGKAQLGDAYAVIDRGEVWLRNAHIPPYPPAASQNHDPERPRRLLLHRYEIASSGASSGAGSRSCPRGSTSMVPTRRWSLRSQGARSSATAAARSATATHAARSSGTSASACDEAERSLSEPRLGCQPTALVRR